MTCDAFWLLKVLAKIATTAALFFIFKSSDCDKSEIIILYGKNVHLTDALKTTLLLIVANRHQIDYLNVGESRSTAHILRAKIVKKLCISFFSTLTRSRAF